MDEFTCEHGARNAYVCKRCMTVDIAAEMVIESPAIVAAADDGILVWRGEVEGFPEGALVVDVRTARAVAAVLKHVSDYGLDYQRNRDVHTRILAFLDSIPPQL